MREIESRASGTTFQEISKKNFKPIRLVVPAIEISAEFNMRATHLYSTITNNLVQSQSLASLRDTLLPKLLSGELRIKDAEKFVENAL